MVPIFRKHNRAPQACRLAASSLMQVIGDGTGQTANDWASSTLRGPGSNSEVHLCGQAGGTNQIGDDGGSSSFTCTTGTANGSLAALNDAEIYAPTSKEN